VLLTVGRTAQKDGVPRALSSPRCPSRRYLGTHCAECGPRELESDAAPDLQSTEAAAATGARQPTLLSVADSTLIGVAIGAAAAGLSGILAAWFTSHATRGVARRDSWTQLELLHKEHAERYLEHRQDVYHQFLNALSRLDAVASSSDELEQVADPASKITAMIDTLAVVREGSPSRAVAR
jgi:gas vesicle protein